MSIDILLSENTIMRIRHNRPRRLDMDRTFFASVVVLAMSFCGTSSAQIDQLFTGNESLTPVSGITFQIAVKEQSRFLGEPVTIYARFRNVTSDEIAIVLGEECLSSRYSKFAWHFRGDSSSGDLDLIDPVLLLPPSSSVSFVLANDFFYEGTNTFSVRYKHGANNKPYMDCGVKIWRGEITSNELVITVHRKNTVSGEEKARIEKRAQYYANQAGNHSHAAKMEARRFLLLNAPYTVPVLSENLEHPDEDTRVEVLSILGTIAGKNGLPPEQGGLYVDKLISAYHREKSTNVKGTYCVTLGDFYGIDHEKDKLIIKTLAETIDQSDDKELRQTAAMVLLRSSRVDGLREIIGKDRLSDDSFFGGGHRFDLYMALTEATGVNPMGDGSPGFNLDDRLRTWWQENKERLIAEQAAADAAREKNQTDNGTSPKTEPEPKPKPKERPRRR
jgi:hypothetical protein